MGSSLRITSSPPLNVIAIPSKTCFYAFPPSTTKFSFHFSTCNLLKPLILHAQKRNFDSEPTIALQVSFNDEEDEEDEEEEYLDNESEFEAQFEDLDDVGDIDSDEEEDYDYEEENDGLPYVCDGGAGGGISLAGTWWDKNALAMAKEITMSFDGDLQIYAFKTLLNSTIQVRIEKLSNKSGSPTMEDVEAFSTAYRAKLDEAELPKAVPENISLEVSSPGVERVVRIPDDLD